MSASVRQFRPGPDAERSVDGFWHATPHAAGRTAHVLVHPDGCIDLVFWARREGGRVIDARLFVAGASERAFTVPVDTGSFYVGVRLRTGMSRILIDADPLALRGRRIDARDIGPELSALERRLSEVVSPDAALGILRDAVGTAIRQRSRWAAPERVRSAIARLGACHALPRVAAIAGSLHLSERSLRRDIVDWTGLSPAKLSRIFRFQTALAMLRDAPERPLTGIALDAGYADHAHMTRDFRALGTVTPSATRVGIDD